MTSHTQLTSHLSTHRTATSHRSLFFCWEVVGNNTSLRRRRRRKWIKLNCRNKNGKTGRREDKNLSYHRRREKSRREFLVRLDATSHLASGRKKRSQACRKRHTIRSVVKRSQATVAKRSWSGGEDIIFL